MSKEHPMERKKRLKKEAKQIRLREANNCDCPRKPDGKHDLEANCFCGSFEKPPKDEPLMDVKDFFWNKEN